MTDLRTKLVDNLRARFTAYAELVSRLPQEAITERLAAPKHKSLGEHLWCVVGARESYARALAAGAWSGFACSMKRFSREDFVAALDASAEAALEAIEHVDDWTPAHDDLLLTLSEHEVMHEGQIIRHIYGVERTLPESWRWA
jgi:hypothetical protein